ncbi:MAG: hypothetical protein B7Y39_17035 [Bdellovibrio sp. 28-41-41]|nr:MAG: hypothetical protein B7Y39_17035 [Bdellovibrio sp. 28-41-41]
MFRISSIAVISVFAFQTALANKLECLYVYGNGDLRITTQILSQPSGTVGPATLLKIQQSLGLDEINFKYLQVLMGAYGESIRSVKNDSTIVIADHGNLEQALGKTSMVVPTAIASKSLMKSVPVTDYASIAAKKADYEAATPEVKFWVKKLMAGTGSGIVRVEFLKEIYQKLGKSASIKIGSKGTDLHAEVEIDGQIHILNIAELQILQLLAQSDKYKQVIFHDVVSNETQQSIETTWSKHSPLFNGKTLSDVAAEKGEVRSGPTVQFHIPTIGETGALTKERLAPAGHGLFAIEAVYATLKDNLPKTKKGESLIGVIGNGEDLMSTPSSDIVGWMAKEQLPLVMVTTEKTALDKQGGQIAIGFNSKGQEYVTIVEKAQAETAVKKGHPEQMDLFAALGLRANVIAPDLITNTKKQKGADGIEKSFVQLEGAMGSVVLKLDRLYRETFNGQPLVHFLNIGKDHRTQYFAPIKSGFDFFMQFHSDRFIVDGHAFKIVDQRPGAIPKVTLVDDFYKEAANVLKAFKGAKILELDELSIEGAGVLMPGLKLSGVVKVKNLSGQVVHLPTLLQQNKFKGVELKNVSFTIDSEGSLMITAAQ